jgi:Leucine Rich Repeat
MQPTPICQWYGLDCEGDIHVVHLNLTRNNLKGNLPKELRALSDLRTLDLARCGLTGALPVDLWTKMTQLEYLWLRENQFTGLLPPTFGNMTSMRSLKLFKNELIGQLPTELNLMTNMMELELDHNKFSGTIPYLAHMKELEKLLLNDNKLEKHIPFEIFRFLKMRELRVEKNFLTGTVPPEMQSMRELRVLSLGSNRLRGTLDDSFDHFDYLGECSLIVHFVQRCIYVLYRPLAHFPFDSCLYFFVCRGSEGARQPIYRNHPNDHGPLDGIE